MRLSRCTRVSQPGERLQQEGTLSSEQLGPVILLFAGQGATQNCILEHCLSVLCTHHVLIRYTAQGKWMTPWSCYIPEPAYN